jgi:hypothetical protein
MMNNRNIQLAHLLAEDSQTWEGTVTVTFHNSKLGTIVVVKNTLGGDDGTFGYTGTGGSNLPASFSITTSGGTASVTYNNIDPDNTYGVSETVLPAGWELVSSSSTTGTPSSFTVAPGGTTTVTFVNRLLLKFVKEFTGSGAINGLTRPEISSDGLSSYVTQTKTGPAIWWTVTYTVTNNAGVPNYYIVWDKWGGNLMVLDSAPSAFSTSGKGTGLLTLTNGASFTINYAGYKGYMVSTPYGTGLIFNGINSEGLGTLNGIAYVTLHTGDQQQGSNPGNGKGTTKDGSSYDLDLRWEIGLLAPGQTATLTIIVAPGLNPGGQLEFTSTGIDVINTGPVVRVYSDSSYDNSAFLYTVPETNVLTVYVVTPKPSWASFSVVTIAFVPLFAYAILSPRRRKRTNLKLQKAISRIRNATIR